MRGIMVALLCAALLLALAGCGESGNMGLSEYRKDISELHDGVAWDLGVTLEELSKLDFEDYYDLISLQGVFNDAAEIFYSAQQQAEAMDPPPQAESLHADLIAFYKEGAKGMGDLANAMGFFEGVLAMITDIDNLALPSLPENAGVEEIKAAAAEDHKTMDIYIGDLEGMEPPDELIPYQDELLEFFRSIDAAIVLVEQAAPPEEQNAFLQFRQWFATALERSQALWDEAREYLRGLGGRVDYYIERGKELAGSIQNL